MSNVSYFPQLGSGNGVGGAIQVATVSSLRALPAAHTHSFYALTGYYADGDAPLSWLVWDAASTAIDDGIFTFKLTSVTTGRMVRRLESSVFDARWGGLKVDGTVGQMARLSLIYSACCAVAGIDTVFLGPGTIDVTDAGNLTPGTGSTRTPAIRGAGTQQTTLKGAAHNLLGSQVGIFSATEVPATPPYTARYWTQDLSSGGGTYSFAAVNNITGLSVGDWVLVRLGADPTDQGLWYAQLITRITGITPGAGVTGTVVVETPVREDIPNVSGINVDRLWNKHDIIKITNLVNGFSMSHLAIDNVHLTLAITVGAHFHDMHIKYATDMFSNAYDENTVVERITADEITGVDVGGGGQNSHLGWFYDGWLHHNTVIRDILIKKLTVNLFSYEGQSRGMVLDNVDVAIDSRDSWSSFVFMAITNSGVIQGPTFKNLSISGYGSVALDENTILDGIIIRGSAGTILGNVNIQIQAYQIRGTIFFKNKNYNQVKLAPVMLVPLSAATPSPLVVPYPLKGVPRRVRIYASSLTGITEITQHSAAVTPFSILSSLTAGQFAQPPGCCILGVNYAGGGSSDSQYLEITHDGTVPAGSYLEIESEFFVSDDSLTTEKPKQKVGVGAPAINADFPGQEYYDQTGTAFYRAITTGQGAADWIAL